MYNGTLLIGTLGRQKVCLKKPWFDKAVVHLISHTGHKIPIFLTVCEQVSDATVASDASSLGIWLEIAQKIVCAEGRFRAN